MCEIKDDGRLPSDHIESLQVTARVPSTEAHPVC